MVGSTTYQLKIFGSLFAEWWSGGVVEWWLACPGGYGAPEWGWGHLHTLGGGWLVLVLVLVLVLELELELELVLLLLILELDPIASLAGGWGLRAWKGDWDGWDG